MVWSYNLRHFWDITVNNYALKRDISLISFFICFIKFRECVHKLFFLFKIYNFVSLEQKLPFEGVLDEISSFKTPQIRQK